MKVANPSSLLRSLCFCLEKIKLRQKKTSQAQEKNSINDCIPDEILEMCLMRLPLRSLATARLVCKKWRDLTTTSTFTKMRREGLFRTPCLFLFGAKKLGILDASKSQWHNIDYRILKGRYLYSVASFQNDIYIVGGRSRSTNSWRPHRSYKSHKEVFVFNALTKSTHEVASMNHERSLPVLGSKDCEKTFIIIVVGGRGSGDEPLDSGEIYDPISNKWTEISRLPLGFGVPCSGVVCKGTFYVHSNSSKLAGYNLEMGYWAGIDPGLPRVVGHYPRLLSCKNRLFTLSVSRRVGSDMGEMLLYEFDDKDLRWRIVWVDPYARLGFFPSYAADEDCIFGVQMYGLFYLLGWFKYIVTMSDVSGSTSCSRIPKSYGAIQSTVLLHL